MDASGSQSHFIGVDALFQYAGSSVQLFSGFVFYTIAVRLFNTAAMGAIAIFIAIVGLFSIVFSFGLSTASQHFTSYNLGKGDYPSVKKTIYRIIKYGFALSILAFITLEILSVEISIVFLHSAKFTLLVRILGIVLFGNVLFGILNGTILGIQKFRLSAVISIVIWVTYYFGALSFAVFLRSIDTIVFGWLIGISLGVIIESFIVLDLLKRRFEGGEPPTNSNIFHYSFPILLSSIISYGAAYADRFIVSGLLNLSALGVYNFSLLIATAIGFMSIPFNNILMPKFSEMFGKNEKEKIANTVEVSCTLLSYFYVPSALGIAALSPVILNLLGGGAYVSGADPLRIIMIFTAVFITQNIMAQAIAAVRRTRLFLYSSAFALVANVVLSILLIPSYGLIGAALGFSSVYGVTFTLLYYFAKKESLVSLDGVGMLKVWGSAIVMFIIVDLVSEYIGLNVLYLPAYIVLGTIIYVGLARLVGIFRSENKELILSLFPSKFVFLRKLLFLFVIH